MKKLDKLIESTVKAMTPLKEYTDNDFSGAKVIADAMQKKPDSEDMEFITKYFPNAVKSMQKAEANLKASDASPIKKRMGQYAPMFVHVQYHTFTETSGQTFAVHQTQYYNSNFKDKPGGEKFNPRVTELNFYSGENQKDKMGVILAATDEYIKDLKDLDRLGMLGKRISESLNEGKGLTEASKLIKNLREKVYRNLNDQELEEFKKEIIDHLGGTINEAIDPKYKTFYDQVYKHVNELDRILGANKPPKVPEEIWSKVYGLVGQMADKIDFLDDRLLKNLKENDMNTKTESIVNRLKEDTEYQKFFKSAMDKFGVKSPKGLSDKKKKEFFNYVDKNYKAKGE